MHAKTRKQNRACFRQLAPGLALALSAITLSVNAQNTATSNPPAATDSREEEIVILNAFTVSSDRDYGYRAANTISGTRSDTPIKDIPLNIQVFTKDLADDLNIKNQVELEAYNASLVNGGADIRSNNPIQQAFSAFLFRGFVQNWGLRDGIREYDPIDTQGISRVEIVKGPAAALYGLAYPGGIMNNVTKDVDFSRNFTSTRFTIENEGGYRAAIDANYTGEVSGGKFGVRLNGAHSSTEDKREHSQGQINYTQLNLNWQPVKTTELKFLAESGYREKPNGLGYFTRATGNEGSVPLQIDHPEIPWEWNWSNGKNMRSLDTKLYRGTINQAFSENFQVTGYVQFSKRNQTDGDGWDANGSGGADSWEAGGGWVNAGTSLPQRIDAGYSFRTWDNTMHAYGATGVYKVDIGEVKNTFTFGANVWSEKFLSRSSTTANPYSTNPADSNYDLARFAAYELANPLQLLSYPIRAGIDTTQVPAGPPLRLHPINTGNGHQHENNSNDYYFAAWQTSMFDNRLKTNVGYNHTKLKLVQWPNGSTTVPNLTEQSENSPLLGAMYDITKEISVFAVHAKSLFPETTKNSFGAQMPPVVGSSVEGGFKFALMEGKINGTLSYYEIKQTGGFQDDPTAESLDAQRWDGMTLAQRNAAFPGVINRSELLGDNVPGAEQKSKGFELDLNYQPTRNLVVAVSFADNDQKITDSLALATIGNSAIGNVKTRWSVLTKYTFSEGQAKGLYLGTGISATGKALQDYKGAVARFNPSYVAVELFGGYRFKLLDYETSVQLNVKNLSKVDEFVGWVPNGTALATQRYRVSTPITYALTFGIDL